ncbi:MAG: M24 family metallopeptidase [Chloroflexi bacterium]|nr:M24 family metallopeptidase [Chloroflexota bacterium]
MAFLDRERLARFMARDELDAMVVVTGHNFHYATGYQAYFLAPGRQLGRVLAVVPADPGLELAVIGSQFEAAAMRAGCEVADQRYYPTWVGTLDFAEMQAGTATLTELPVQYDLGYNYRLVADVLRDRGLRRPRLGVELAHLNQQAYALLIRENPDAAVRDSERTWADVRTHKTPAEIELIRQGVFLAEAGIRNVVDRDVRGLTAGQLRLLYVKGVVDAALGPPGVPDYQLGGITNVSFGPDPSPKMAAGTRGIADGDVLKFDVGAIVAGYGSDLGRNFMVGPTPDAVRRVQDAMLAGLRDAVAAIRPGARFCDVYAAGMAEVRRHDMPYYSRGHIGHTIGAMGGGEESPFIGPNETRELEPGMVLAVEVPAYVRGLGAFQNEHDLVVTDTGVEILDTLPIELLEI